MKKLFLYYHTLKYLKFKQIRYRAYYMLRRRWRRMTKFKYDFNSKKSFTLNPLTLQPSIPNHTSFLSDNSFSFLNLEKTFSDKIDWNFDEYGKLWTYNLTYFEYLNQENIDTKIGVQLIHNFIQNIDKVKDGLEPFPISLRIINWVKFLIKNNIKDTKIDQSLYIQTEILADKLEYHLLGNHLLENGFALLFANYYFSENRDKIVISQEENILPNKETQEITKSPQRKIEDKFHLKAHDILTKELKEQILPDGAHFELSPMYHCLMLYRVLDCINLLENNFIYYQEYLCEFLREKAALMLGWLHQITFQNGDFPRFNDSAPGIAPTPNELFDYATRLNVEIKNINLKESGYRKFQNADYECIVDIGNIGPDYIPGHAHSDTFNFIIHSKGQPFIVDTGISTYESNANRQQERSTSAHNTVQIGEVEQSEIWSSFRVARRAYISNLNDTKNTIKAAHTGYARIGATHEREFVFSEKEIFIKDNINTKKNTLARAFLHFHPDVKVEIVDDVVHTNFGKITFEGCKNIKLASYMYAKGFNKQVESVKIIITFENDSLETRILL